MSQYNLSDYGNMLNCSNRVEAYHQALKKALKSDSILLELGTGIGFFALLACHLGASKVYAVESNAAILVAQEIALANGQADKIKFIKNDSSEINLAERVDVIISDLRGVLPLFENHISAIVDARQRFLSSSGVLIPQSDKLWACLVEAPLLYQKYDSPWNTSLHDITLGAGRQYIINDWSKVKLKAEQLLSAPYCWATLDYMNIVEPDIRARLNLTVTKAGTGHGLGVWFDTILFDDVKFSNAPDQPDLIYGQAFFPWLQPVSVSVGDVVKVSLQASPTPNGDYLWAWSTKVFAQDELTKPKASFQQSNFFSTPLSSAQLRKQAAHYLPSLNPAGHVARFTLELMEQSLPLAVIAEHLMARFPHQFATSEAALSRVGELSCLYSK